MGHPAIIYRIGEIKDVQTKSKDPKTKKIQNDRRHTEDIHGSNYTFLQSLQNKKPSCLILISTKCGRKAPGKENQIWNR